MGVSVVLGGCLAMLAWQPDWVAVELRRLAVALAALSVAVFALGAASAPWLLVMLLAVGVFAGVAHVLRPKRAGDRVAA
jgi:predicted phage tail protein